MFKSYDYVSIPSTTYKLASLSLVPLILDNTWLQLCLSGLNEMGTYKRRYGTGTSQAKRNSATNNLSDMMGNYRNYSTHLMVVGSWDSLNSKTFQ